VYLYRLKANTTILAETLLPTEWGTFRMIAFSNGDNTAQPHIALVHPSININSPITLRIHSECLTGDLFHSLRCDCGQQLDSAMQTIAKDYGVLIYLRQEGRGIGLVKKMEAYNLQDKGLDTVEANIELGFGADDRKFSIAIDILEMLNISKVNLLTNNPEKIQAFDNSTIAVAERLPLIIKPRANNSNYLETKKTKLGHLI
jgi:GTP cyclohydrolase II